MKKLNFDFRILLFIAPVSGFFLYVFALLLKCVAYIDLLTLFRETYIETPLVVLTVTLIFYVSLLWVSLFITFRFFYLLYLFKKPRLFVKVFRYFPRSVKGKVSFNYLAMIIMFSVTAFYLLPKLNL